MRPQVLLHNAVSLDGYVTGFDVNLGLYYELASRFDEDATLAGCDTLLTGLAAERIEPDTILESGDKRSLRIRRSEDTRPLLVVPDSRGRLRSWGYLLEQPYWRGGIALCSARTPPGHLDYLDRRGIWQITAGEDHADLGRALEELAADFGVERIRVDGGGILNGVLLAAGLVDEVSLLVHPVLVGDPAQTPVFQSLAWASHADNIQLEKSRRDELEGGLLWLCYTVKP